MTYNKRILSKTEKSIIENSNVTKKIKLDDGKMDIKSNNTNEENANEWKNVLNDTKQKQFDLTKYHFIPKRKETEGLKILAWNVNGLRALLKKGNQDFEAYIEKEDPDILCLSETKIDQKSLDGLPIVFSKYKYKYWSCATKKGYAGTALFSKKKPNIIEKKFFPQGNDVSDNEGRYIAAEFENFWLIHTYVPNAGSKLERLDYRTKEWDVAMLNKLKEIEKKGKNVIWCGDLNVAHQEIDIHDPKSNRNKSPGFTDVERERFTTVLEAGFIDVFRHFNPEKVQYTYWSYRFNAKIKNKGWRLDYFIIPSSHIHTVEATFVREKIDGSDHVPIGLILKPDFCSRW